MCSHVARMEEGRSAFENFLTSTPTRKRPLGRPRRKWEDNIRMHLKEIGIKTRNWAYSAQDRDHWRSLVNAALNLRVPHKGKRSFGSPKRRWENNIKIYVKEIGINTRDWVDSAQDRDYRKTLANVAMNLRVP